MEFNSRRSVVHSVKGIAASTQPLAAAVAIKLLDQGCNAAEAAVGCSAALAVVEPGMTSLGDAFCLYFNQKTQQVEGINGSGKSSRNIDLATVRKDVGEDRHFLPLHSPYAVNVPGAALAWIDIVKKWGNGKLSLLEILQPAIELARGGFPVSRISSDTWQKNEQVLSGLLIDGKRAPREGEIFKNEDLAQVFERIGKYGKEGFYEGPTADAIVEAVQSRGGCLDHEDLKAHESLFLDPISVNIPFLNKAENRKFQDNDTKLWELPPNNHGIVALLALNIIDEITKTHPEFKNAEHNSAAYIHMLAEALKLAFKDAEYWVADPLQYPLPEHLLTKEFAESRAKLFDPKKANYKYNRGDVIPVQARSDTSYYTVVDAEGNACSMISSLYYGFGTGIVPEKLGFALHNRGCNFSLDPNSRNALGPSKRCYHTIIPALITSKGELLASMGVMGGFMQPQGHVQVALNLLSFNLDPQECMDAPRICLTPTSEIRGGIPVPDPSSPENGVVLNLEDGIDDEVVQELKNLGHKVEIVKGAARSLFGRGQIIVRDYQHEQYALHAGSDPRGDGAAIPQV